MDGSLASLGPSVERSGEPARPRFPPVGERLQQPLTLALLPANDDPSPRKAPDSRRPGRRALRRPLWSPAAPTSPSLVCALCRRFRALDCCWHPGPWRRQTRGVRRGCWIEPPPAAAAAAVELPLRAQHAATDEPCLQVADAALHKVCTCLSPLAKNDTRIATSPQVHCSGMHTESCAAPEWLRGSTCLSVQCSAARSTGRPPTAGRARAQAPLPWPAAGHRAHLGPAFLHQSHVV
ncbi:hypothetical protein VFPFJ_06345 [Purpureocillium lilacinum]|uniref:Uncharacterized protein n=1 Tax=Purpureocillium lilacinum TaxID=33203 RepID=A0A179HK55_PURLI|nr:hypothetical protein VFPFJ_06345 [Purpureocillium lilacinum]OAQ89931.1 hypothetical protein VFPFJ_06345 [Purpureocillium lilacinum]